MNPDEVARICDELHQYVDQGLGENPGMFAAALNALLRLRAAASWDYPLNILMELGCSSRAGSGRQVARHRRRAAFSGGSRSRGWKTLESPARVIVTRGCA
jgi:hypothetical protein